MRTIILFGTIAALGLAHPADARAGRDAAGRKIVERDCGACHATAKRGPSPLPAAPPFRTLSERYDVDGLAEALAEGISVGHPKMPEFSYPPDQIDRVIGYLKSLQPTRPTVRPR